MGKECHNKPEQPVKINGPFKPAATDPKAIEPLPQRRDVEWYRQCPHCWENLGGAGTTYKTMPAEQNVGTRYYKCDKCGMSWSRDFEIAYELVSKRVVTVIKR